MIVVINRYIYYNLCFYMKLINIYMVVIKENYYNFVYVIIYFIKEMYNLIRF